VRLQKVLARAGVGSRRASEELIARGAVEVNGELVAQQGVRVDPARDVIRVDGRRIPPVTESSYLALNKPVGVISAMSDPRGRPTLAYLLRGTPPGLFHVGRLDSDTSGLLLLTNDGEFAQRVAHPSYEVEKKYLAEVEGRISDATVKRLRQGVMLEDGPIRPNEVKAAQRTQARSLVNVTLHEGRNRVVRRMFDAVGHPVLNLSRPAVRPVRLSGLRPGQHRPLTADELGKFFDLVGL
jgi:23S rRNA pseudouridine2605 synthase